MPEYSIEQIHHYNLIKIGKLLLEEFDDNKVVKLYVKALEDNFKQLNDDFYSTVETKIKTQEYTAFQ